MVALADANPFQGWPLGWQAVLLAQVDYFISHWWGTPFMNFCESVRRHAIHMSCLAERGGESQGGEPSTHGAPLWFSE